MTPIVPASGYVLVSSDGSYRFRVPLYVTVLGRQATMCGVLQDRKFVSRFHAQLTAENGELLVRDLNSTHGTFVNGIRLGSEQHPLKAGDLLILARPDETGYCFTVATEPIL